MSVCERVRVRVRVRVGVGVRVSGGVYVSGLGSARRYGRITIPPPSL